MPFDDAGLFANTRPARILMRMESGFRSGEWGWTQDALERNGSHCLVGAMDRVEGIRYRDMAGILGFLAAAIQVDAGDVLPNFQTIARYNNAAGRTLDDILAVIAKARALASNEAPDGRPV
jgi:hypothetical protein